MSVLLISFHSERLYPDALYGDSGKNSEKTGVIILV